MKLKMTNRLLIALAVLGGTLIIVSGCDKKCTKYSDHSAPAVPSGVYTVTGDEQVTVHWSPIVEDDFDYYVVWRADEAPGPYHDIGTTTDNVFVDTGLINGRTYYWAVSSVDFRGNESDLSYETVFDTPRPAGSASIYDYSNDPGNSGFSLANERVVDYNDQSCDFYLDYQENPGVFLVRTGRPNTDIQDFGYTDNLNDVNFAPANGWSELGYVEVILGHSYIIWTADNHFAAFRITSINSSTYSIGFDYAYQTDADNRELKVNLSNNIKKTKAQ